MPKKSFKSPFSAQVSGETDKSRKFKPTTFQAHVIDALNIDTSYSWWEFPKEISVHWTTGGLTGGNCYGDSANEAVEAEPEPEFEQLDKLLEVFCPNITYLHYKKLIRDIVHLGSETDNDYYGNYYCKSFKTVNLEDLERYLRENKLWGE